MSIALAIAQFAPSDDKDANLERIRALASQATRRGAQVVAFPEYSSFTASALDRRTVDAAEPLDGPFVSALRDIAASSGIALIAGVNERSDRDDRFHNSVVCIDPRGELAGVYRKVHLFDAFGSKESDWIVPGEVGAIPTLVVDDIVVGVQTCFDVRFPEITRMVVETGAHVVVVPAQWVPGPLKELHWDTLLRARAIENTVYVAGVDQAPPRGAGRSVVYDPMGVAVAAIGEVEAVVLAPIDPDRVAAVRDRNPTLALRRFRVIPDRTT